MFYFLCRFVHSCASSAEFSLRRVLLLSPGHDWCIVQLGVQGSSGASMWTPLSSHEEIMLLECRFKWQTVKKVPREPVALPREGALWGGEAHLPPTARFPLRQAQQLV